MLVVWTIVVTPMARAGVLWVIYPIIMAFPLVVLWHFGLLIAGFLISVVGIRLIALVDFSVSMPTI